MEETRNVEKLERLYKEKTEKERLRAELYNRLDSMME
nr:MULTISPECIES: ABC transporter ATP-binding protein [Bacillus]